MPYQNALQFSQTSDITFVTSSNDIEIKVSGQTLGKINHTYPVTVFVDIRSGGKKWLCMKEITDAEYTNNNTSARTIIFHFQNQNSNLNVGQCSSANQYKMIGVEDENVGGICVSGNANEYFDITSELNFKSKIELKDVNGTNVPRMFVRYAQDTVQACTGSDPTCSTNLFCYKCN